MSLSHAARPAHPQLDPQSSRWVERLRAEGPGREAAVKELHVLLLKAARFEVRRRRAMLGNRYASEHDDLVQQSADDALVAILRKLDDFRGQSRFTTWVYKFALYEAAVKVRRRAWQGREVQLESQHWPLLVDSAQPSPQQSAETRELMLAIQGAIENDLSARQRNVLMAVVLNDVPIDILAERLHTTRGALYKTLHDARQKLRAALTRQGFQVDIGEG